MLYLLSASKGEQSKESVSAAGDGLHATSLGEKDADEVDDSIPASSLQLS